MSDVGLILLPTPNQTLYYGLSVSKSAAFAANVATTSLAGVGRPPGTYRAEVTLVATVLATLAANVAFNILSTDAAGAFTAPVPLVAGVTGLYTANFNLGTTSRASGSLVFEYAGGAAVDISFSIQGITTPGPLAAAYNVVLTRIR